jgi:mRNA interferase MazF
VISADLFNQGASGLVVVLPVTSKDKGIPFHIKVEPPEGGVKMPKFYQVRGRKINISRTT